MPGEPREAWNVLLRVMQDEGITGRKRQRIEDAAKGYAAALPPVAPDLQEAIDSPALQDALYEDMVASWPHILGEVAPPEHVEQAKAGARRSALRSANAVRAYLLAWSKGWRP